LTRWRRQKVTGNVVHERLENVTLHFKDDERVPSANAQREGNFEVNRTKLFYYVVSHVLESGERLRATKTGEGNSGEDGVCTTLAAIVSKRLCNLQMHFGPHQGLANS
jgi:hypothetical protein